MREKEGDYINIYMYKYPFLALYFVFCEPVQVRCSQSCHSLHPRLSSLHFQPKSPGSWGRGVKESLTQDFYFFSLMSFLQAHEYPIGAISNLLYLALYLGHRSIKFFSGDVSKSPLCILYVSEILYSIGIYPFLQPTL
jgi:hypothetical protein